MGQSKWSIAKRKQKTWEAIHLMNRRGKYGKLSQVEINFLFLTTPLKNYLPPNIRGKYGIDK
jgi:hypothetical protein